MKEELLKLYQNIQPNFKTVVGAFPGDDLAGPFLMSPDQHYRKQKKPLLIVGQETNGWTYHIDEISKQMDTYEEFNVGKGFDTTTFWNVARRVERALGNDPHSCAWTNLSKFDLYGGKSYGKYEKMISSLDKIIVDEIITFKTAQNILPYGRKITSMNNSIRGYKANKRTIMCNT